METTAESKSNLSVVQQAFADFVKGNIPAVLNACTEDIEWGSYNNPDVPYAQTYHGKDGAMKFFMTLAENIDYTHFEPGEYICQGDYVVALGHHTGKVRKTGKTFDHDWCFTFKMHDGKLQRFFAYVDTRDQGQAFK